MYKHISLCGVIWLTKDRSKLLYWNQPMNADKLYMSLPPNIITANWLITFVDQIYMYITPSPDKHYSCDSEDDFHSICRNVRQQRFFWELTSPGQSQNLTNYFLALTTTCCIFFYRNLVHHSQSCHQDLCSCECKKCNLSNWSMSSYIIVILFRKGVERKKWYTAVGHSLHWYGFNIMDLRPGSNAVLHVSQT